MLICLLCEFICSISSNKMNIYVYYIFIYMHIVCIYKIIANAILVGDIVYESLQIENESRI